MPWKIGLKIFSLKTPFKITPDIWCNLYKYIIRIGIHYYSYDFMSFGLTNAVGFKNDFLLPMSKCNSNSSYTYHL